MAVHGPRSENPGRGLGFYLTCLGSSSNKESFSLRLYIHLIASGPAPGLARPRTLVLAGPSKRPAYWLVFWAMVVHGPRSENPGRGLGFYLTCRGPASNKESFSLRLYIHLIASGPAPDLARPRTLVLAGPSLLDLSSGKPGSGLT